ncbi:hypothetical protein MMC25_008309 [Agyrium rufum]|nr:hypothetical protein [Agyrium rufum]
MCSFLIWQLRSSYLTNFKDGVGDRLISIDSSILNDPAFRAAGWALNYPDARRTYSPPIPTAVSLDYFSAPSRTTRVSGGLYGDDDEEGGAVTGLGSAETVGPGNLTKKRRKKEAHEEDDSSDLSDDSDEDLDGAQRAVQQIKFSKMPVRHRAGSSPLRDLKAKERPDMLITSPSRKSFELRRDSLGAGVPRGQRNRGDTVTSSEISSENELDPALFRRRQVQPHHNMKHESLAFNSDDHIILAPHTLSDKRAADIIIENSGEDSDGTGLSSDFGETADSESLLDEVQETLSSLPISGLGTDIMLTTESPRKTKSSNPNILLALPPPRPISTVVPISALGQAIRSKIGKPANPIEAYARFSGKGASEALNIRIYAPFSEEPYKPFDMPMQKAKQDGNGDIPPPISVADAIGLSLWRYNDEGLKPLIPRSKLDVNQWTLRMVDDGEVEYDFPALSRTTAITDFTSNNNRTGRGRARGKTHDEFALVEATESQFEENRRLTPEYSPEPDSTSADDDKCQKSITTNEPMGKDKASINTVVETPFALTGRKLSSTLADRPTVATAYSTPRIGPPKLLKIYFTNLEAQTHTSTVEVTTDTYLAEVLDNVCKKWNLDKAHHFLRVTGTTTVAPSDRTVESIGTRTDLDLVRRRFAHDANHGLLGSPGSRSPNAPLQLNPEAVPRKGKRSNVGGVHPLSQKQDLWGNTGNYRKYAVVRKQPMSFAPSHQRTLLMDGDYMHILPGETGKTLFDSSAKSTTVPFSMIVGCKVNRRHPKTFRVVVFREREKKRYDFEAQTVGEAADIVEDIRKGMKPFQGLMDV